jgi:FkbM family methyltransferase
MQIDEVEVKFPYNGTDLHLKMPNRTLLHALSRFFVAQDSVGFLRVMNTYKDVNYVMDVGANMGFLSILFAAAWPEAEVHALEPSQLNFGYLTHNTEGFPNIVRRMMGAYYQKGYMKLALPPSTGPNINTGQLSIYGDGEDNVETIEVGRLDDIADRPVDFLKLDVEGAEIDAMEGAPRILSEDKPILMVEIRGYVLERAQRTPEEVFEYIVDRGYKRAGNFHGDFMFVHEDLL